MDDERPVRRQTVRMENTADWRGMEVSYFVDAFGLVTFRMGYYPEHLDAWLESCQKAAWAIWEARVRQPTAVEGVTA